MLLQRPEELRYFLLDLLQLLSPKLRVEGMGKKRHPLVVIASSSTAAAQTASRDGANPLAELTDRFRSLEAGVREWMAKHPTHIEAAVTTTFGAVQGGALHGQMSTFALEGGLASPCRAAPSAHPSFSPDLLVFAFHRTAMMVAEDGKEGVASRRRSSPLSSAPWLLWVGEIWLRWMEEHLIVIEKEQPVLPTGCQFSWWQRGEISGSRPSRGLTNLEELQLSSCRITYLGISYLRGINGSLPWMTRMKIAVGAAKGLAFSTTLARR